VPVVPPEVNAELERLRAELDRMKRKEQDEADDLIRRATRRLEEEEKQLAEAAREAVSKEQELKKKYLDAEAEAQRLKHDHELALALATASMKAADLDDEVLDYDFDVMPKVRLTPKQPAVPPKAGTLILSRWQKRNPGMQQPVIPETLSVPSVVSPVRSPPSSPSPSPSEMSAAGSTSKSAPPALPSRTLQPPPLAMASSGPASLTPASSSNGTGWDHPSTKGASYTPECSAKVDETSDDDLEELPYWSKESMNEMSALSEEIIIGKIVSNCSVNDVQRIAKGLRDAYFELGNDVRKAAQFRLQGQVWTRLAVHHDGSNPFMHFNVPKNDDNEYRGVHLTTTQGAIGIIQERCLKEGAYGKASYALLAMNARTLSEAIAWSIEKAVSASKNESDVMIEIFSKGEHEPTADQDPRGGVYSDIAIAKTGKIAHYTTGSGKKKHNRWLVPHSITRIEAIWVKNSSFIKLSKASTARAQADDGDF
jgi:hypothetical protein